MNLMKKVKWLIVSFNIFVLTSCSTYSDSINNTITNKPDRSIYKGLELQVYSDILKDRCDVRASLINITNIPINVITGMMKPMVTSGSELFWIRYSPLQQKTFDGILATPSEANLSIVKLKPGERTILKYVFFDSRLLKVKDKRLTYDIPRKLGQRFNAWDGKIQANIIEWKPKWFNK